MPDRVAGFGEVLQAELAALRTRREKMFPGWEPAGPPSSTPTGQQAKQASVEADVGKKKQSDDAALEKEARNGAYHFRPLGVGLSGGGIRSATFNLGVLQGLSTLGLLPYVDYLSTVSGGGYIGTWLHGVIRRKDGGDPRKTADRLNPSLNRHPGPPEEDPVTFLRKYSNYLAPKLGLFSSDFWVIFTIWLRNMGLNLLILIPFLASLTLIALLVGSFVKRTPSEVVGWPLAVSALLVLGIAVVNAAANLLDIVRHQFSGTKPKAHPTWPTAAGMVVSGLLIFCVHWRPRLATEVELIFLFAGVCALHFLLQFNGGFRECFNTRHKRYRGLVVLHLIWMPLLAGAVTGGLLYAVLLGTGHFREHWHPVLWGPPSVVLAFIVGVSFHMGLMGSDFPDACREWLARVGAVGLIDCFAWTMFTGLSFFGPWAFAWLSLNYGAVALVAILGWAGSTMLGVGAGTSPATSGTAEQPKKKSILETVTQVAPTIFMIGLLVLIAWGCHWTLGMRATGGYGISLAGPTAVAQTTPTPPPASCCENKDKAAMFAPLFAGLAPFVNNYNAVLNHPRTPIRCLYLLLVLAAMVILLPLRFNINEFSLHHFYKNRLVRCYLGAGNGEHREPNRFTGFDPKDDIPIAKLLPSTHPGDQPYYGPYAIVNTSLNLNAGSELAKQERKADSFIFTPLFCGFNPGHSKDDLTEMRSNPRLQRHGYRSTHGFFDAGGPDIGTAMAISGAAANPNWGYHTSASVAFMLTIFNVRLGWWLGNPRVGASEILRGMFEGLVPSKRPGPLYGLLWLIWELLAQTTGRSKYVNLSDGGHFENLGLYELVRRRCRYIIIGDGEEDPEYTFESLGGAIRKCRADFGVEIDIDIDQIRLPDSAARTHCVVGTIVYPEDDPDEQLSITLKSDVPGDRRARGWILYLKSSLTGDEPEDVKQYKAAHPVFPQEPTLNQFFTESQFESYRRLGLHVVDSTFENAFPKLRPPTPPDESKTPKQRNPWVLDDLFQSLAALWYPPSTLAPGVATKHADAYAALMKRLGEDPELLFLGAEVVGASDRFPPVPPDQITPAMRRKGTMYILQLIQLMENVWDDFRLRVASNRENPGNSGWIKVFRRWAHAQAVRSVWNEVRNDYNELFQAFFDEQAKHDEPAVR